MSVTEFDAQGGETCDDCGRAVAYFTRAWWHTDDDLWMEVVRPTESYGAAGRMVGAGVLCPPCFTRRCDALGIHIFWHARVEYRDGESVIEAQRNDGPGSVHVWDQGLAEAQDKLRRSAAFVLVTLDRETRQVDLSALSCDLDHAGMVQLLDVTVDGCLASLYEVEADAHGD